MKPMISNDSVLFIYEVKIHAYLDEKSVEERQLE